MRSTNRSSVVFVLLAVGFLVFIGLRLAVLRHSQEEKTSQGRILSTYRCGELARLSFYGDDSPFPVKLFVRNDFSRIRCAKRVFFLEPTDEEMLGDVSVYRDTEPDGTWDRRVDFSGRLKAVYPEGGGPAYEYFELDEENQWRPVIPSDKHRVFVEVVLGE